MMTRIDSIVQGFNLENTLQENKKKRILERWREYYFSENEFELILDICSKFHYYSLNNTAITFEEIFKVKNNKKILTEHSLFMAYKSNEERTETAVGIFLPFMLHLKINTLDTYTGITENKIRKLYKIFKNWLCMIEKEEKILSDYEKLIENVKAEKDKNKRKQIGKDIQEKKNKIIEFNKKMEDDLAKPGNKELGIDNLILIDDFIGSGSSLIKLFESVGDELKFLQQYINIYFICLEATDKGLEKIESKNNELGIFNFNIIYYTQAINVLAEKAIFSGEKLQSVYNILERIENEFNLLNGNSYIENTALATFMNAPNNNVPILSVNKNGWMPLFERTNRTPKKSRDKNEINDKFRAVKKNG